MVSGRKTGKTVHTDTLSHVNLHCKEDAVQEGLLLPICHADELLWSVGCSRETDRTGEHRNYAELKLDIFDKVHMFLPHQPPALPESKIFS
jgi:hypothetical protein